jgi:protein ImuB
MLTARVAAAGRPRNSVVLVFGDAVYVPPGREADFLAPLPLERLAPELRLAATLSRWGLHAIGDLARLPESDVAARLGEAGAALHAKACGADPEPFLAHVPPSAFTEGFGFDWPVTELSSFMAFARAALERLIERLAIQGLGATRLDLELRLDPEGTDARTLTLPPRARPKRC